MIKKVRKDSKQLSRFLDYYDEQHTTKRLLTRFTTYDSNKQAHTSFMHYP